jgi:hypothetical protein
MLSATPIGIMAIVPLAFLKAGLYSMPMAERISMKVIT